MKLLRIALPLALVSALAAIGAGSAAAGGDAGPPVYPSLVHVQMVSTEKLLEKAATYEDEGDSAKAVAAMTAVKSHLRKAWLGAKYVIDNAPPPVAGDSAVVWKPKVKRPARKGVVKVKAHTSGGAIAGASPFADQYTTAVGVLGLQHDVASACLGMLDTADAALLPVLSSTLFAALNGRDTAIAYIHSIAPPPVAGDGSVHGHSSGGAVAGSWATVMPGVLPYVDDELQAVDGIRARVTLSPGRKKVLDAAELQDTQTERTLNRFFPPLPPAG